jgi:hypothetical protein
LAALTGTTLASSLSVALGLVGVFIAGLKLLSMAYAIGKFGDVRVSD